MKLLVLTCLLAATWAVPLARPDDDDDQYKGPEHRSGSYETSGVGPNTVFTGYQPMSYPANGPGSFARGSPVPRARKASAHPARVSYGSGVPFRAVEMVKYESGEVGSVAVHASPVAYTAESAFVPSGQVSYSMQKAAVPTVMTYNAGRSVVPAQATQVVAAAPAVAVAHAAAPVQYHAAVEVAPSVATVQHTAPVQYHTQVANVEVAPAVGTVQYTAPVPYHTQVANVEVAPAVGTVQYIAPVQYHAQVANVEVAPAVGTVQYIAPVQYHAQVANVEVAPAVGTVQYHTVQQAAVAAVPTAITYQSEHTVELPSKEINIPVQNTYVYRPVEKRINYETENYVAGTTTTIHKPKLSAPAIAAPQVFKSKTRYAAPEVTVHHSEVTVEEKSPNYVAAPYDAGVVVEKAPAEIKQVDVPTPVEVPQPVAVPTPYHVKVAQPVKVKSSISPVVNVDVHSVQTENVVTPVEYTAHHHVATAPVVAQTVPVVATGQAVTTGHYVAQAPEAVVYGAAVPFGQEVTYDAGHSGAYSTGLIGTFGAGQAAAFGAAQAVTFGVGQAAGVGAGQVTTYSAGQSESQNAGVVTAVHGFNQFGVGVPAGYSVPAGYAADQQFKFVSIPSGAVFTEQQQGTGQFVQGTHGQFVYPQHVGGHSYFVIENPTAASFSTLTGRSDSGSEQGVKSGNVEYFA